MIKNFANFLTRNGRTTYLAKSLFNKKNQNIFLTTASVAWKSDLSQSNSLFKDESKKDIAEKTKTSTELNSVSNEDLKIVLVRGLPQAWNDKELASYFDKDRRNIEKVSIVKNRLGVNTGKAMIFFKNKTIAEKFIKDWDHNMIDTPQYTQQIAVSMFQLKTRETVNQASASAKQVYVYNLSFDCTNNDLYSLACDYGEIMKVELPTTAIGKSKGFGYVTFQRVEDAKNFLEFAQESDFMGRKIKIQAASTRYEGKNTRKETYSDSIFKQNQSEEDKIKGENFKENMKLYDELIKGKISK